MTEPTDQRKGITPGMVAVSFLGGLVAGAVAGILLAPQSGRASREQLRDYARRTEDEIRSLVDRAMESVQVVVEEGQLFFDEQKRLIEEAIQSGRDAMRREREANTQAEPRPSSFTTSKM